MTNVAASVLVHGSVSHRLRLADKSLMMTIFLYLVFTDRIRMPLLDPAVPVLSILLTVTAYISLRQHAPRPSIALMRNGLPAGSLPYISMQAILPVVTLLIPNTTFRSVGAVLPTIVVFSGLSVAIVARSKKAIRAQLLQTVLPAVTIIHGCMAAVQAARLAGWLPHRIAGWSMMIDLGQVALIRPVEVFGRSTGMFANPNVLGLWGAGIVVLALTSLHGHARVVSMGMGAFCVLASGSRGMLIALIAGMSTWLITRSDGTSANEARRRIPRMAILWTGGLFLAAVLLVAPLQMERFVAPWGAMQERALDQNLVARFEFWQHAWAYLDEAPLGTIRTPEYVLGTSIDSDIFRTLSQGGPGYLAGLMWMYSVSVNSALRFKKRLSFNIIVVFAIAGLSMSALLYTPAILLWVFLGLEAKRAPRLHR